MSEYRYPLTLRFELTDAWIENVLMWDSRENDVDWNRLGRTYGVKYDGGLAATVTYGGLTRAVQKIISHETSVTDPEVIHALLAAVLDDGDSMTGEMAERIVEVAAFGDIMF